MLVLDENLPARQRHLLRSWRIRFRVVGGEVAFSGAKDENLIPVLHRLSNPTFFSLDRDFFQWDLAHSAYCLVWLDVRGKEAAGFIRRFLRHPSFDTQAKRMGGVARGACRRCALVAYPSTFSANHFMAGLIDSPDLSAFAKSAGGPRAWSGDTPAAAGRSGWATRFHSRWPLPPPAARASGAIPNPARGRFAATGSATQ